MILCDYGCGGPSICVFKNGQNCCSRTTSGCPVILEKNKEKHKGIAPTRKCIERALESRKGLSAWNKGLTKETNPELARPYQIGKRFASSLYGHTEETKKKLSNIAKERKLGGYVQGSGRGKKGWYKGFFCDSSWELAYIIYCLDHHIDIKRNKEKRQYVWQGVIKNYIPDFIVEGITIEVKGYKTNQWLAKLESNPDIKVLYETDLQEVLEYVKNKYGKDFIKLYE